MDWTKVKKQREKKKRKLRHIQESYQKTKFKNDAIDEIIRELGEVTDFYKN